MTTELDSDEATTIQQAAGLAAQRRDQADRAYNDLHDLICSSSLPAVRLADLAGMSPQEIAHIKREA